MEQLLGLNVDSSAALGRLVVKRRLIHDFGAILLLLLLINVEQSSCSGVFQVQLISFLNENGLDADGNCCDGERTGGGGGCSVSCPAHFRICLSHYQAIIPDDVSCTFGSLSTPLLGTNSIYFSNDTILSIPFDFTWPRSFALIIDALYALSTNAITSSASSTPADPSAPVYRQNLIYRLAIHGTIDAGDGWQHLGFNESDGIHLLTYQYQVVCNDTYYGPGCSETCQPRDDKFGHYVCNETGSKICNSGWTDQYCDKAVCLDGCDEDHGYCEDPNECKCRLGWQGKRCDQCIPYPGCQHGSCDQPWQCNCDDGWGGLFCNQDLNFCTHYRPCRNGGTCSNTGQGSYSCTCPPAYTGTNCELELEDCDQVPCQNGGSCSLSNGQYRCTCSTSYYGSYCQWSVSGSCGAGPCLNNGTCTEVNGRYMCACAKEFTGSNCELEMNECTSVPCLNGGTCISTSNNDFACLCALGYGGQFCQDDENHCAGSPCLNGGTCAPDATEGFTCGCVPGFVGVLCQDNVDDCLNYPCANGATCVDLVNDFLCACAQGFSGRYCNDNVTMTSSCASSPCMNGGTCVNRVNDFDCICPAAGGLHGKRCDQGGVTQLLPLAVNRHTGGDDVTSAGLNAQQMILIAVLGVALPVLILLVVVIVLLVWRKHRRRQSEAETNENVRYSFTDVNNQTGNKMATVARRRPLKITNKERQQRQEDRRSNIYTVDQEEEDNNKRYTNQRAVTSSLSSRDIQSGDCACVNRSERAVVNVNRTRSNTRNTVLAPFEADDLDKPPFCSFGFRDPSGDCAANAEQFPWSSGVGNVNNYSPIQRQNSPSVPASIQILQYQDYVLATEV